MHVWVESGKRPLPPENPGQLKENLDSRIIRRKLGQSLESRDGWQLYFIKYEIICIDNFYSIVNRNVCNYNGRLLLVMLQNAPMQVITELVTIPSPKKADITEM